jgi:hypothetical protein
MSAKLGRKVLNHLLQDTAGMSTQQGAVQLQTIAHSNNPDHAHMSQAFRTHNNWAGMDQLPMAAQLA